MGQIKHKMGKVGGGVDISHKSKMSNAAKNQMSYPGGMPGPGNYGSTNNVVGKGMTKYLAGESVGMRKYGKHMGPEKALVGNQENLPEGLKAKIEAAPEGPAKRKMTAAQKKLVDEIRSKRAKKEQAAKAAKTQKKKVNKELDTFLKAGGEVSSGPGKMTRKQRQEKRAEKRVNRGEKRSDKLQKRIANTTDTVLKAKRQARKDKRDSKVTMNKESVGKNFVSDKEKAAKARTTQTSGSGTRGFMKAGPMKTDPKDGVVVSGDKKKVNNKVTKTDAKAKKIALLREKNAIKRAKYLESIKEKRELKQVRRDLEANKRIQKKRQIDGKDYQANTGEDNQKTIRRS